MLRHDGEDQEQFLANPPRRLQFKLGRACKVRMAPPLRNCWRCATAENFWADGEMQFIHEAGAEQRVVQVAAAFAEQTLYSPLLSQPAESGPEIDFISAADLYLTRQ